MESFKKTFNNFLHDRMAETIQEKVFKDKKYIFLNESASQTFQYLKKTLTNEKSLNLLRELEEAQANKAIRENYLIYKQGFKDGMQLKKGSVKKT